MSVISDIMSANILRGELYKEVKSMSNKLPNTAWSFMPYGSDDMKRITFTRDSDGKPIGFIEVVNTEEISNIVCLYVSPEYRRFGVATDLIMQAVDTTKTIACSVVVENSAALNLYKSIGFEPAMTLMTARKLNVTDNSEK